MQRARSSIAGSCRASQSDLGCREARHRAAADDAGEIRKATVQLVAFGEGAAVVPQQRRPERLVGGVEQGDTQHLAGKADGAHRCHRLAELGSQQIERGQRRPATNRAAPARTTAAADATRPAVRRLGGHAVVLVHDDGLHARRADIDAEIHRAGRQPEPRSRPSAARPAASSTTRTEQSLARSTRGENGRLVQPARRDDHGRDVAQHADGRGDHAIVERVLDGLAPQIEEGAHDVADGAGGAQRIDRHVARQAVADQQRAAAEIADAHAARRRRSPAAGTSPGTRPAPGWCRASFGLPA